MNAYRKEYRSFNTDASAKGFIILAFSYLLTGLLLGVTGGFQYILPDFLKDALSFQKTRPLHVYLVITWIFTAAQGAIYYFIPRIANREIYWAQGVRIHLYSQVGVSLLIIGSFFGGHFGGREYLEFPPWIGALILLSWLPFAINFFMTLRPDFKNAPVYIWNWTTGILFFYITVTESYLWLFEHFNNNIVRDITVQWKALGSMVGSWNMLVYGAAFYVMDQIRDDQKVSRSPVSFAFYFLGLANLLFNWGHHTYIVPAAPWVKTVAYVISMTELLILGSIIWNVRRTLASAKKTYNLIPYRLLSFADGWIFINLTLAILISIPAINLYTHGTHITVAHAMGTTIGINTMLLLGVIFYVIRDSRPELNQNRKKITGNWILMTNLSLLIFFSSLIGSGFVRIFGKMNNVSFSGIIEKSLAWFRAFTFSGVLVLIGLSAIAIIAIRLLLKKRKTVMTVEYPETREIELEERLN